VEFMRQKSASSGGSNNDAPRRRTVSAGATIISKGLCGSQEAEPGCGGMLVERRDAIREDERERG